VKLAVLPARGASQRIPRKNIRPFCGKPIIAWSIETALNSACFDRVIVSTDDAEIADVARSCGAEVPFVRPAALADHHTATMPVVRHAIEVLSAQGEAPTLVCCLYATAPFVTSVDLREGLRLVQQPGYEFAFPVVRYAHPIERSLRLDAEGHVHMLDPQRFATRSQDLPATYHDAGQFYWGRSEAWLSAERIFSPTAAALILPAHRVQDIDTFEDWQRAELMFRAMQADVS
jgi:pseudaminic acid cytidylyltransferase